MKFSLLIAISIASFALFQTANSMAVPFENLRSADIALQATSNKVPITIDNFDRADTHLAMYSAIVYAGSIGKISSLKTFPVVSAPQQAVSRMNRDTVYSVAVFDLSSDVTLSLPPTGDRYMSVEGLNEEDYVLFVSYPDATRRTEVTIKYCAPSDKKCQKYIRCEDSSSSSSKESGSREKKGGKTFWSDTRYMFIIVRILVNPLISNEFDIASEISNDIIIKQNSIGQFILPNYDVVTYTKLRLTINALAPYLRVGTPLNNYKCKVDRATHMITNAAFWGGLPPEAAAYNFFYPATNGTDDIYTIRIKDAPCGANAFWSFTVYNAAGYLQPNPNNSFSINSFTGKPETDGSFLIYISNVKQDLMTNWIYSYPNWNGVMRVYKPTAALGTTWNYPQLTKV